jgi:pimeloyl-ACP methyl ester carboxylesterase
LLFPGTPGSRLTPLADVDGTKESGARIIVLERPGFGVSSPQPGRRVMDWPSDVADVADALGLQSFAIAGMSGAGPYLAACAVALPDRVRAVGMMGVGCPLDAPDIRRAMTLKRRLAYYLLPVAASLTPVLRALGPIRIRSLMTRDVPRCDKDVIAPIREAYDAMQSEAFRQGFAAFTTELSLLAQPWGLRLESIRVPVHLWHGELDVSTPAEMGRYLAAVIPGCRARFLPDAGHFVAFVCWKEILAALAP